MFYLTAATLVLATVGGVVGGVVGSKAAHRCRGSKASAYATSQNGTYKLSSYTAPVLNNANNTFGANSTWDLSVDDSLQGHKQVIQGFGAAVTDATVSVLSSLSDSDLSTVLSNLVTTNGSDAAIGFSLFRHSIGSSDLSADPAYTYDDSTASGSDNDNSLSNFYLGDRGNAMASFLAKVRSISPSVTLLGTPWAPPGWMQQDGELTGNSDTSTNTLKTDSDTLTAWANYFVKYLQAFSDAGASINAVTIQNEPLNSHSGMPTLYLNASTAGSLINDNLVPTLESAGLGNTSVWAYDHNTDQPDYPAAVLSAAAAVDTVAWHCYADPLDWTVLTSFHEAHPNVSQYMTECWISSTGQTEWHWPADFTMGPLQNWADGVVAWTLATDGSDGPHLSGSDACSTCQGLVTVENGTVTYQTGWYVMGQFSRFIPRGAIALNGTGSYTYTDSGAGIQSIATLNPDLTKTVVIENTFTNTIAVTVTLAGSGKKWTGPVPANTVVTWQLPA